VTVTVLVDVSTDVVVLVTVLLDGASVVVGAADVVGVCVVGFWVSVTVSVVPFVAGALDVGVLAPEVATDGVTDVPDVSPGPVVPVPANFTTA